MKNLNLFKQRTRIVATIGPASSSVATIENLIKAGMNVARLNLSHGTSEEHSQYIKTIRSTAQRMGTRVAILIDLPGPKYRTGNLTGGKAVLKKGGDVVLTTRSVEGNASLVPVNLASLPQQVKAGNTILIDDGAIQLKVISTSADEVSCKVIVGGELTPRRGVVAPGMRVIGPYITKSLIGHIQFAINQRPDFIALSFVTQPEDIRQVREILEKASVRIPVISKIERGQAVDNFNKILKASDGIMVARGDLGVDIPLPRIPVVQKNIIKKCNRAGKPVITATQMLESMIKAARPTRAEVTDVANAIFDGSDAIMLSAETSVGRYPGQAVKIMAQIARETERHLPYAAIHTERKEWLTPQTEELISYNACHSAHELGAAAIVAFTSSGSTAHRVSKHRPKMPIIAITPSGEVCGRLLLSWGVQPFQTPDPATVDELFALATDITKKLGLAASGDLIVVTAGIPVGLTGSTNLLKVEKIK